MAADIAPVLDDNALIDVRPVTLDAGVPKSYGMPTPIRLADLANYFAGEAPAATTAVNGTVKQAAAQANSTATDVAGLVADFNALLAKLRTAGILAT